MRRKACIIILLVFFISVTRYGSNAQDEIPREFVTSGSLTIDDVKVTVAECLAAQGCKVQTILGIQQEANSARVFVVYTYEKGKKNVVIDLVRFNSGKWYNTHSESFVIRHVAR